MRNNIKWQCDKCVRLLWVSIEQCRERKYNNMEENKKRCTSSRNAFARYSAKCKKEHAMKESKKVMALDKNDRLYWRKLNPGMNRPQPLISIPNMTTFFKGITCPDNRNFVNTKEFVTRYLETDLSVPVYLELDLPFMDEEIKLGINSLKNNKAAGSDELVNELYKVCLDLQPCLTVLFNKILYSGKYPSGWTCWIIIPIFKKGNPNDIKNYRGITLLSTLSKLFTKVIHSRLAKWSEQYSKIEPCRPSWI